MHAQVTGRVSAGSDMSQESKQENGLACDSVPVGSTGCALGPRAPHTQWCRARRRVPPTRVLGEPIHGAAAGHAQVRAQLEMVALRWLPTPPFQIQQLVLHDVIHRLHHHVQLAHQEARP